MARSRSNFGQPTVRYEQGHPAPSGGKEALRGSPQRTPEDPFLLEETSDGVPSSYEEEQAQEGGNSTIVPDPVRDEQGNPAPVPIGLKELDPKESALLDRWEKRTEEDGTVQWINNRDFNIPGGAVPGGTIRSLEDAYALEVQRLA